MDWNYLEVLVAVAETGSLSAAARRLGKSQPTLSRHVAALELALGGGIFARHPRGLALTERGQELYALARSVADEVDAFARRASADEHTIAGTVRISASEVVAMHVLPTVLVSIRQRWPAVELEVVADNRVANLPRRDADLAIRMFKPTQGDLVARFVADAAIALYAAPSYLEQFGRPSLAGGGDVQAMFRSHTFLGLDRDDQFLRGLAAMGLPLQREDFRVRCDAQAFHVQAVAAGLGIAAVQRAVAARLGLVEVLSGVLPLPALPVWLVAHADLRRSALVRAVWDALHGELAGFYAATPSSPEAPPPG